MKKGGVFVICADLWAGFANMSIPDMLQSVASLMAIASSLFYLLFYIRDKIKKPE